VIGLDTNVVVRYLLCDDPTQSDAATRLIDETCSETKPAFIGSIVLCEVWWVLRKIFKLSRLDATATIHELLENSHIRVHQPESIIASLETCRKTDADFADCLIVLESRSAGAPTVMTFDRGARDAGIMSSIDRPDRP
jgi:predicted nucleic-acid-binding protein